MPPPSAVTMPNVTTPTMSSLAACTAVSAPLRAKAKVPPRSNTNNTEVSVATAGVYRITQLSEKLS